MSIDANVVSLAKRPKMRVYRTLMMKRREQTGEYESSWQTIPSSYVKKWGNASWGMSSDVRSNFFSFQGMDFEFSNEDGYFNEVTDIKSFFYGKLSVYRTLVRVDAGYLDDSNNKYPNTAIYVGIIGEGIKRTDSGAFQIQTDHISKIFQEFPADRIAGLGTTQTASDMIAKIRDHTDSNSTAIFQKYITTTSWYIDTTTNNYNIATSTSLQDSSVWEFMKLLAEAENKLLYIDGGGEFYFKSFANTSASVYHFSGLGDSNKVNGKNILNHIRADEDLANVWNRVRIKFNKADTTTSYYTKEEVWAWGDSTSSFRYGVRTYEYENEWLDSVTAQTVATTIFNQFKNPTVKANLKVKFLPGIEVKDRVTITHLNGVNVGGGRYDVGVFDTDVYGEYKQGSINYESKAFYVDKVSHNITDFYTNLVLQEEVS